jgi:hypothetical protein
MPSASVTVTAVYISIPKLTVVGGGIEGEPTNSVVSLPGETWQVFANPTPAGKVFDKWTVTPAVTNLGDYYVARDTNTVVVMPTVSVTMTATYIPIPKLTVVGGSIDGAGGSTAFVMPGEEGQIMAGEPVAGKVFDKWTVSPATASLGEFFNPRDANTTVTMPGVNVTVTATYLLIPKLTVAGGGIEGESTNVVSVVPFEERQIYAGAPASGKMFDKWTWVPAAANLGELFNVRAERTAVIMPSTNLTLTAVYAPVTKLTVVGGGVVGEDVNPAVVLPGEERQICANDPADGKMFDKWTWAPATTNLGELFNPRDANTTIIMPRTNMTMTAVFVAIPKLTVNGGSIEGADGNVAFLLPGDVRQVYAGEPAVGKMFDKWTWTPATTNLGEGFNPLEMNTTVVMPSTNVTLTAVYLPIPKLTVAGGHIDGEDANPAYVLPGEERSVAASAAAENKGFEKWVVAPALAKLGELFDPRQEVTTVVMPTGNVTLTAMYVTGPGTVHVHVSGNTGLEPSGILWSVDNMTWAPVNTGYDYLLKPGRYTVSFKSVNVSWLPPAKQTLNVVAEQLSEVEATATYVPVVSWQLSGESAPGGGTVTMSPASGQVLPGKSVTLTARPASNYVFVGWEYLEGMAPGSERSPSLTIAPALDTLCTARFRASDDCEAPAISFSASTECMVGVAYRAVVEVNDAALPVRFTASALPAGLTLDPVTGVLSGVPTAPTTAAVTLNASNGKGAATPQALSFTVLPLPVWAQGTFAGAVTLSYFNPMMGTYSEDPGTVAMSVTAQGKITGRIACGGTNYTFSAAAYETDQEGFGTLNIVAAATAGKVAIPLTLSVWSLAASSVGGDTPESLGAVMGGKADRGESGVSCEVNMRRSVWKDAGLTDVVTNYTGYYTATLPGRESEGFGSGYLALTVDSAGNVKTAGKLADGTPVSMSGPLIMDENRVILAILYAAPAAYKGGCLFGVVEFVKTDAGTVFVRPYGSLFVWKNNSPLASSEYGVGFDRDLGLSGGWYDKLINLRTFYASGLSVGDVTMPSLIAAVKYTDWADTGLNKLVWTEDQLISAATDGSPSWLPLAIMPAAGTGIGLAAPRADVPVKDAGTGVYDYAVDTTGDGLLNSGGLTLAFTRATGLFRGSFKAWYDYVSSEDRTTMTTTTTHTSKAISFEGLLTPVREEGSAEGRGFFLWADKGSYDTGKTDSYGEPVWGSYNFISSYDFLLIAN